MNPKTKNAAVIGARLAVETAAPDIVAPPHVINLRGAQRRPGVCARVHRRDASQTLSMAPPADPRRNLST